jgi:hypothetical protein
VNSTKDQEDQDHIGAILDEVVLLFDTLAKLLEGFVYFLPKQLQSWAKAKIEGKICMTQMIHIPEYVSAAEEEADDNVAVVEEEADDNVTSHAFTFQACPLYSLTNMATMAPPRARLKSCRNMMRTWEALAKKILVDS